MKIKTISIGNKYRMDISVDVKKNLNFIHARDHNDRTTFYNNLEYAIWNRNSDNDDLEDKDEDNFEDDDCFVDLTSNNLPKLDLMFVSEADFAQFPSPESIWRKKFDELFSKIFKLPPSLHDESSPDLILGELNSTLIYESPASFKLCMYDVDMCHPRMTDVFEPEFLDKIYFNGRNIMYPQHLTYVQKIWLFFSMLFFIRNMLNYDFPLIIDSQLFAYPDSDRENDEKNIDAASLLKLISDYSPQSIIFISDPVFFNNMITLGGPCPIYGIDYDCKSIHDYLKAEGRLGTVHEVPI